MWAAARSMGMTEALFDGLPVDLPATLPDNDSPTFALVAGMTTERDDRIAQAYCFIRHDVIGVAVAFASTLEHGRLETWAAILNAWRQAGGDEAPPPQLLGATLSFIAHAAVPEDAIPAAFSETVRDVLRSVDLDRWDTAYRTADGFSIWDWQDPQSRRVVVALTSLEDEDELSRWLWWRDEQELASFGRYLLNASKLGYESRVYGLTRRSVADRVHASDERITELRTPRVEPTHAAGLQEAQQRLADAQTQSSDLAIELTRLKALQRTIGIARHNLTLTTPAPATGQRAANAQMFERDQALAGWLEAQIDQDVGYAQGAIDRAREAQQMTQLRLQQQLAGLTRAQSRVALLQTSLVAALLASFTMINIFQIRLNLVEGVKVPLLSAGVALLLALPPLAAHWFERYGPIDHLAAALCGATAGWLLAAIATADTGTSVVLLLAGSVLGAAIGWFLTLQHDRRFRRETRRPDRGR